MEKYAIVRPVTCQEEIYYLVDGKKRFATNIVATDDGEYIRLLQVGSQWELATMQTWTEKTSDATMVRVARIFGVPDGECQWKVLN